MADRIDGTKRREPTEIDFTAPNAAIALRASKPKTEQQQLEPWMKGRSRWLDDFHDKGLFQAVRYMECGNAQASDAVTGKPQAPSGPTNDDVLYIGLNSESTESEVAALKAGPGRIETITATVGDVIKHGAVDYNLHSPEGRRDFIRALGLTGETATKLDQLLGDDALGAERPNIAAIAVVWSRAEHGGTIPSRLVLSGHSGNGETLWGGEKGITLEDVRRLARAMPMAARQIEDIHVASCSSSNNPGIHADRWTSTFPNLKTIWAYNGSAPKPTTAPLTEWSVMTKGRSDNLPRTGGMAAANVAVWSVKGDYKDQGKPLQQLKERAAQADTRVEGYKNGSLTAKSSHEEPLYGDFKTYLELSHHKALTEAEQSVFKEKAAQLLRIRFYNEARVKFATTYADEISKGYAELGMPVPRFDRMTRAEAVAEIARVDAKVKGPDGKGGNPSSTVSILRDRLAGLLKLEEKTLPSQGWQ